LLPTIRSRCQGHTMHWPAHDQALSWLSEQAPGEGKASARPAPADLQTLLAAAGGRPADALDRLQGGPSSASAQHWQALPKAMARGDVSALTDMAPAQAVDALQKLCHDMLAVKAGAQPRFFSAADLPGGKSAGPGFMALGAWSKELGATARTVEHPYNPGLMLETLASRARQALAAK
jgi:DNA polymerase-3 subunit delta'